MICPHCKKEISPKKIAQAFGSIGGKGKSPAKTESARNAAKVRWERYKVRWERYRESLKKDTNPIENK